MTDVSKAERKEIIRSRWLAVTVVCLSILSLLGVVVTAIFVVNQRAYNSCQRQYNDSVQAVIRERGTAGDLDRQALQQVASSTVILVDSLLRPDSSQEQRILAIQTWRDAQDKANQQLADANKRREANPIPLPVQC